MAIKVSSVNFMYWGLFCVSCTTSYVVGYFVPFITVDFVPTVCDFDYFIVQGNV
jgi:hypothetical protein